MKTLKQETRDLRERYDEEPSHSDHVTSLALQIFDALRSSFSLNARARELLEAAALLHDIGWSQTPAGKGHHKETARLINESKWESLTPEEVSLVAQIGRYHRKTLPRPEHVPFQALSDEEQNLVLLLGGILRIADALDRTHTGRIKKVKAEVSSKAVTLLVSPRGKWPEEKDMFEAKKNMLELAVKRPVLCDLP